MPKPDVFIAARRTQEALHLELLGEWRAALFPQIELELRGLDLTGTRQLSIRPGSAQLDLSGAWLLRSFLQRAREAGVALEFEGEPPPALTLLEHTATGETPLQVRHVEWLGPTQAVEDLGRRTVRGWKELRGGLDLFGRICVAFGRGLGSLHRLRPISVARHVYDTGITAIPIVALIGFLISVILAYMGAQELRQFGAEIFTVDLVTVGVLRELGVLLTAIIVAGRSGSAFAAEIGAMQLNEEVDALRAIGVNPVEVLILPRVLGLCIALPLLTVVADVIGLVGGALLCHELLNMPLTQYMIRAKSAIAPSTFWVGIIKAPVFAALIAIAGVYCGMQVRGSSRELGRLTTSAVVQAIFFVILVDALFAVLFLKLDI
jgi:phospholipid/cholesterol/gamma-HCH transport system permease protein